MEAIKKREREKVFCYSLEWQTTMRNLRILPQNITACWLLVGSGVVTGGGGRAQVKVLYGKTYVLLSSLVLHSDLVHFTGSSALCFLLKK